MRGGPIEGEGQCKGRLPEEWTHGDGGFKNGGTDNSSAGEGGGVDEWSKGVVRRVVARFVRSWREEVAWGKERMTMATGALHRGATDNFVVKKWKGKRRGPCP
jgi:hypothetical protein